MDGVDAAVDEEHAVFARPAVGTTGIEIIDRQHLGDTITGETVEDGDIGNAVVNAMKMLAGVKTRPTQEDGKDDIVACSEALDGAEGHLRRDQMPVPAKASRCRCPRGWKNAVRWIDDWPIGSADETDCRIKGLAAEIRIADRIEDEIMRGKRHVRIEMIGIKRCDVIAAIVEPEIDRDIAAAGRDEHQDVVGGPGPAIGLVDDGLDSKAAPCVTFGCLGVTFLGQNEGETAMCGSEIGFKHERLQEMLFGGGIFLADDQDIGEIGVAERFARMFAHRLLIGCSRGRAKSGCKGQRGELGQNLEMRRGAPDELHIVLERGFVCTLRAQVPSDGKFCVNFRLGHDALACCDSNHAKQ